MTIRDLEVAPDNPLSRDAGTVVRRITGRGGFRGREDLALVHLETGGSREPWWNSQRHGSAVLLKHHRGPRLPEVR